MKSKKVLILSALGVLMVAAVAVGIFYQNGTLFKGNLINPTSNNLNTIGEMTYSGMTDDQNPCMEIREASSRKNGFENYSVEAVAATYKFDFAKKANCKPEFRVMVQNSRVNPTNNATETLNLRAYLVDESWFVSNKDSATKLVQAVSEGLKSNSDLTPLLEEKASKELNLSPQTSLISAHAQSSFIPRKCDDTGVSSNGNSVQSCSLKGLEPGYYYVFLVDETATGSNSDMILATNHVYEVNFSTNCGLETLTGLLSYNPAGTFSVPVSKALAEGAHNIIKFSVPDLSDMTAFNSCNMAIQLTKSPINKQTLANAFSDKNNLLVSTTSVDGEFNLDTTILQNDLRNLNNMLDLTADTVKWLTNNEPAVVDIMNDTSSPTKGATDSDLKQVVSLPVNYCLDKASIDTIAETGAPVSVKVLDLPVQTTPESLTLKLSDYSANTINAEFSGLNLHSLCNDSLRATITRVGSDTVLFDTDTLKDFSNLINSGSTPGSEILNLDSNIVPNLTAGDYEIKVYLGSDLAQTLKVTLSGDSTNTPVGRCDSLVINYNDTTLKKSDLLDNKYIVPQILGETIKNCENSLLIKFFDENDKNHQSPIEDISAKFVESTGTLPYNYNMELDFSKGQSHFDKGQKIIVRIYRYEVADQYLVSFYKLTLVPTDTQLTYTQETPKTTTGGTSASTTGGSSSSGGGSSSGGSSSGGSSSGGSSSGGSSSSGGGSSSSGSGNSVRVITTGGSSSGGGSGYQRPSASYCGGFTDLPYDKTSKELCAEANWARSSGLFQGSTYDENLPLIRRDVAFVIARYYKMPAIACDAKKTIGWTKDFDPKAPANLQICQVFRHGILTGFKSDNTLKPEKRINLIEMVRMMYQTEKMPDEGDLSGIAAKLGVDNNSDNRWYLEAIKFAIEKKIFSSDTANKLTWEDYNKSLTRGEVIKYLYQAYLDKIK